MPLISVPAIYDDDQIKLLEPVPVTEQYRVLVTFVAPATDQENKQAPPKTTLKDLKGIWSNVDLSIDEIKAVEG